MMLPGFMILITFFEHFGSESGWVIDVCTWVLFRRCFIKMG